MKLPQFLLGAMMLAISLPVLSNDYVLTSPDGKLKMNLQVNDQLALSIRHETDEVLAPTRLSMKVVLPAKKEKSDTLIWGDKPIVKKEIRQSKDQVLSSRLYKREKVQDCYNELTLIFKGGFGLILRAYDDGCAYRFVSQQKSELVVMNECADFQFSKDYSSVIAYSNSKKEDLSAQYFCSFENTYERKLLSKQNPSRLAFLPLMVELDHGKKLNITEANLEDYPGMFLLPQAPKTGFKAMMAQVPDKTEQGGHNMLQRIVKSRHDYIARTKGERMFPWRVFGVSIKDAQMASSDLVYKLAEPSRLGDDSWIKPGKVAWDWWNDWNLEGVPFVAGINNETYKYYIDFAAKNGIEYVILDEGFNVNKKADLMQIIPEIDLKWIVDYAASKKVGIILWAGYWAFNRDMENVVKHYAQMGVKGFKVDFLDHDDQDMVNFVYKSAAVAAKYNMLVDFHGVFKPTGLQRTYPNVINFEGVHGLEQLKWSPIERTDMPLNDVFVPYLRMFAGPLDYTQGAMRNATKKNYRPINSEPMSQGTRVHQLALYMIYDSPLTMLCDAPTNYEKEPACTEFIASIPTIWDETLPLNGEVGEYLTLARRKGSDWYLGSITNFQSRKLNLDLSFLGEGNFEIRIYRDGINAARKASDFAISLQQVPASRKMEIEMAPGGGWAAVITRKK